MTDSILLLTGQSGSGKTVAVHALEDHGYYCIDNMPITLMPMLLDHLQEHDRVALVMDVRDEQFAERAPALIGNLRQAKAPLRVVYFEANEMTLIRRYSETRRRHPLDHGNGLRAALADERERLAAMRELADETLDTSEMTPHVLRDRIGQRFADADYDVGLSIGLMSFGFKYGLPLEADVVFDVRFLPNPYFEPTLKDGTGQDSRVRDYVFQNGEAQDFVEHMEKLLGFLFPLYHREGKRYLTVAIGCTGGQHRSVALVEAIQHALDAKRFPTAVTHRELASRAS